MNGYGLVSSAGPFQQSAYDTKVRERWAGLQIDGESSVLDEAVMGPAAGLVQCRVCHALAVHAWDLAMAWVHMGRLDSLPLPLMRHLKLFADSEVHEQVLKKVTVRKQALQTVPGMQLPADALGIALVPSPRQPNEPLTPFEIQAVQHAAGELLAIDTASQTGLGSGLLDATMAAATAYAGQLQAELGSPPGTGLDPRTVLAPEGQAPDGVTCLDHHHKCSHWASQGECEANPGWMVGGQSTLSRNKGHCRLSCGTCLPSISSGLEGEALQRMQGSSGMLLEALMKAACSPLTSCKIHGELLLQPGAPGAAQHRMAADAASAPSGQSSPTSYIDMPDQSFDPTRAVQATVYDQQVEADFLHERSDGQLDLLELEQDMARILGQSCTYVSAGWWTYELCYLRSVRQLHVSSAGVPDQVHLIGSFDGKQTVQQSRRPAVALLERQDWLPGMTAAQPSLQHVYTGGTECNTVTSSGKPQRILRSALVKVACSPDGHPHLLVREPEQCGYDLVLYSPTACNVEELQPSQQRLSQKHQEL
ncbi:hypothetical protein WJX84_001823 [Apatococcus fuscideae]|uniref:Protein OS-9 homolog n=1 Tax=Apatococcus fuscideae TaxID=2026836 RepID=A0AAW1RK99_9CHLO